MVSAYLMMQLKPPNQRKPDDTGNKMVIKIYSDNSYIYRCHDYFNISILTNFQMTDNK